MSPDDQCGDPICPFAYNSVSDWYRGDGGPSFILVDPGFYRLGQAPPAALDQTVATVRSGDFTVYEYADDVAAHMGVPRRFTRPLL